MENQKIDILQNLTIIAKPKHKDKLTKLLLEKGAHSIDSIYGHGSVSKNILAQAFGLDVDQTKVIISCLVKSDSAKDIIDVLYNEFNFNKPNSGIAFTIPVEGLLF